MHHYKTKSAHTGLNKSEKKCIFKRHFKKVKKCVLYYKVDDKLFQRWEAPTKNVQSHLRFSLVQRQLKSSFLCFVYHLLVVLEFLVLHLINHAVNIYHIWLLLAFAAQNNIWLVGRHLFVILDLESHLHCRTLNPGICNCDLGTVAHPSLWCIPVRWKTSRISHQVIEVFYSPLFLCFWTL